MMHGNSKYDPELADEICMRLMTGLTLKEVCRMEDIPVAESTVRQWSYDDVDGFHALYVRAREIGFLAKADEMWDIAATPEEGVKTKENAYGTETIYGDMIEHRRLKIDTIKFMLVKMFPRVFGERTRLEHTGKDGQPLQISTEQTAIRLSMILENARRRQLEQQPMKTANMIEGEAEKADDDDEYF
jgi:Bacteriophage Sf6, terminase small subunit-like